MMVVLDVCLNGSGKGSSDDPKLRGSKDLKMIGREGEEEFVSVPQTKAIFAVSA
jgi:hypothetical protein